MVHSFCCSNFSYWCQDSTIMCVGFVDCNKIEYILGAENEQEKDWGYIMLLYSY